MPAPRRIPTVRARALGAELEQLRKARHLTPEDVARAVGGTRFKVRDIEMAKLEAKEPYLSALLSLYGVLSSAKGKALLALAEDAWQRGWWTEFADVFRGSFVSLEDQASQIRSWQPQLIPGVLQTEGYGRAVLKALMDDVPPAEVDRRWQARLNRQALLTRERDAPQLGVVLDAAILERPVGGEKVMRAQLRHLLKVNELPNVSIQVLPKSVGAHAGLEGPLVILSFPGEIHPDIAYVEMYPGDVYLESADEVERANVTMGRVQKDALSIEESANLIGWLAKE